MFYNGQKELEMQYKMNKIIGQCRQKCEALHEKFTEKLEQVHTAYQKMAKKCQMMEKEVESLSKDKQELQEKYAEKSRLFFWNLTKLISQFFVDVFVDMLILYLITRQKRKLDEMYDKLRSEYESVKRSSVQPANFFSRAEPDLFSSMANMMDGRATVGQGNSYVALHLKQNF